MSTRSGRLAGTVRWAIVPYTPRPPFRLYAGESHPPIVVDDPNTIIDAAKKTSGESELTYLVSAKARPVLILSEPPPAHHQEITALRLLRFSKLLSHEQEEIRQQRHELLFYLSRDRFRLREENAAMVSALVRLHVNAISSGPPLGALNDDEMRVLGERMIRYYQFDIGLLVEQAIRELLNRRR